MSIKKILIIGAVASGKTTLAKRVSMGLSIPVIHIDRIEFNLDLSKKNIVHVREQLKIELAADRWILDGHGPLDLLPSYLGVVDVIIFIDFPLPVELYHLVKRQLCILFRPREELPLGANEWQWHHFKKMYQTLFKQHRLFKPELRRIFKKPENQKKLIHIQTYLHWKQIFDNPDGIVEVSTSAKNQEKTCR